MQLCKDGTLLEELTSELINKRGFSPSLAAQSLQCHQRGHFSQKSYGRVRFLLISLTNNIFNEFQLRSSCTAHQIYTYNII